MMARYLASRRVVLRVPFESGAEGAELTEEAEGRVVAISACLAKWAEEPLGIELDLGPGPTRIVRALDE